MTACQSCNCLTLHSSSLSSPRTSTSPQRHTNSLAPSMEKCTSTHGRTRAATSKKKVCQRQLLCFSRYIRQAFYLMIPMDLHLFHLPTALVHYIFASILVVSKETILSQKEHKQRRRGSGNFYAFSDCIISSLCAMLGIYIRSSTPKEWPAFIHRPAADECQLRLHSELRASMLVTFVVVHSSLSLHLFPGYLFLCYNPFSL